MGERDKWSPSEKDLGQTEPDTEAEREVTALDQLETMSALVFNLGAEIIPTHRIAAAKEQLTGLAISILLRAPAKELAQVEATLSAYQRSENPIKPVLGERLRREFAKAAVEIIQAKGSGAIETAVRSLPKKG